MIKKIFKFFKRETFLKISGLAGILLIFITAAFLYLTISNSPNFSLTKNWLSDLGSKYFNPDNTDIRPYVYNSTAGLYFNISLIAISVLTIIFALGIGFYFHKNHPFRICISMGLFILGAISLIFVVVFPEYYSILHKLFSFGTVIPVIIAIYIINNIHMKLKNNFLSKFSYFLIGVAVFGILFIPKALGEIIIIFCILLWTLIFGIILMKGKNQNFNQSVV